MAKSTKKPSKAKVEKSTSKNKVVDKAVLEDSFHKAEEKTIEWMMKNPEKMIKERKHFMQQLLKKRCCYGGKGGILPITISPLFLKEESMRLIANVGEQLDRILDKVTKAYFEDEYVASYFPYTDIPKEWINWDSGYEKPTILNRHDAIFDGKNLKFIEFNTDNPGGRGWCDISEELFRKYTVYGDLIEKYSVVSSQVVESMAVKTKKMFNSDYGLATTGNAGPNKGDSNKEVGTVFIGIATPKEVFSFEFNFGNSRERVTNKAVNKSFELLLKELLKN